MEIDRMKKTSLIIFQLILLLISVINISAQSFPAATTSNVSDEKIYIHYDKPYYAAGETIWFKCYMYSNGLPSVSSHNLYLYLIDEKGRIMDSKKYPISGATVKGNFNLGKTIPAGCYTIKALTAATANDGEFAYTKNIYIYNAEIRKDTVAQKKIVIQFFPESGNLVDNIFTQVAFKATDEYSNPINVSGIIRSGTGAVAGNFRSTHAGIGKFSFYPHSSTKYFAEIDINDKTVSYPLPDVQPAGTNLKVIDEPGGKVYELAKNSKTAVDSVRLVVRLDKQVVFDNQIFFGNELLLRGHLNTTELPSGILRFTLYNSEGVPLSERVAFVNNSEYKREPVFEPIRTDTAKRGMNSFQFRLPADIQTSCSIAITDAAAQAFSDRENIYSRLLLSSDLKGYIYDPAWYFQNNDNSTKEALDNLMMIHGWSRYNIKKNTINIKQNLNDEYLLTVSGTVNDVKGQRPVSKGTLKFAIVSEDSTTQQITTPVDNKGKFSLDSLLIFGKAKLYYSYTSETGIQTNTIITIDKSLSDSNYYIPDTSSYLSASLSFKGNIIYLQPAFSITPFEKVKQLAEVVVEKKEERPSDKINEKYTSGMFRSSGKIVLDNINKPYMESSLSVVDYIKVNIPNIVLTSGGFVNRKNMSLSSGAMWSVAALLNESPASVASLAPIRMKDVALIKFYEAGFAGVGSGSPGGAVAVYLKGNEDGAPSAVDANSKVKYIPVEGYSVTQEFYSPDYSVPNPMHSLLDKRITLYWNPDANTSATSPLINIKFYNNDLSKKFYLVLEGVDNSGKLIHYEREIGN